MRARYFLSSPKSTKLDSRPSLSILSKIQGCQTSLPSGKRTKNYGKSPFWMGKSSISMAIFNSSPDPPWAPQTRHMKPDSRAASSSRNGWWTLSWSTSQPGGFSSTSRSSVDVGRHPKCKWTWKSSYRCICYIYICGMIWRDRKLMENAGMLQLNIFREGVGQLQSHGHKQMVIGAMFLAPICAVTRTSWT